MEATPSTRAVDTAMAIANDFIVMKGSGMGVETINSWFSWLSSSLQAFDL